MAGFIDDLEQRAQRVPYAVAAHGGNDERRFLGRTFEPRHLLLDLGRGHGVGFVQRHDLRLLRQLVAIGDKFAAHGFVGRAGVSGGAIDEMQQYAATFDVAEEAVAEAGAFMRTFDQARNVGEHEFAAVDIDDAKLRIERGERIVGDFRLWRR